MITPRTQNAIDQGLAYLHTNQHANGSFGTGQHQGNVAITSLGGLALMAGGHQPGRGRYGHAVTLRPDLRGRSGATQSAGRRLFAQPHGTDSRSDVWPRLRHALSGRAHGMVNNRQLRERLHGTLTRAVQLIIETQNHEGGWRDHPQRADADLSVTICQIMALRRSQCRDFRADGHRQQLHPLCQRLPGSARRWRLSPTCAASARPASRVRPPVWSPCTCRRLPGRFGEKRPGLFDAELQAWSGRNLNNQEMQMHYYYGHYYAAQAMWIAGGRYWTEWYPAIREELVQHPDRQIMNGGTQCCCATTASARITPPPWR